MTRRNEAQFPPPEGLPYQPAMFRGNGVQIEFLLVSIPVAPSPDRVSSGNVVGMHNRGSGITVDRDSLFNQHHRDAVNNRIEDLPVGPEKAAG